MSGEWEKKVVNFFLVGFLIQRWFACYLLFFDETEVNFDVKKIYGKYREIYQPDQN